MTNALIAGADLLANDGMWCTAEMLKTWEYDIALGGRRTLERPKVCLVGAVLAGKKEYTAETISSLTQSQIEEFEEDAWSDDLRESPEIRVLAEEVVRARVSDPDFDFDDLEYFAVELENDPLALVYNWNDDQSSHEPVIALLRKAAQRLEQDD